MLAEAVHPVVDDAADIERDPIWQNFVRWETALVLVLCAALLFGNTTPNFMSTVTIFFVSLNMGEIAIMALPVTLIIITGEIDLSVASMLGLSSTLLGYMYLHGVSMWLAVIIVLVVGAAGGALNGLLVTRLGLPSIAVTIGTLTLFRGIALIILGAKSVTKFPASLTKIGVQPIPHTQLSYSIGIFIVLAIGFAVVLHLTPIGRSIFAIGMQSEAAHFSGIRVNRIKFRLYVLSGLICAFAGVLWTFKLASARYDGGAGLELNVVAIVLFGGVSIFGGRGSIFGVVIAATVLGVIQQALTLRNVDAQVRNIVTGVLLLVSVVLPNIVATFRRLRAQSRNRRQATTELPSEHTPSTSPKSNEQRIRA
jgi:rhamnose transport system permease protein